MKKIQLILLAAMLSVAVSCTQSKPEKSTQPIVKDIPTYELYPTTNMWNFVKLNTRNGKMWLVQYSVEGDESRFVSKLNDLALVSKEKEHDGRFKLQATQNIHNFILLDQTDGRTWQVQWSFEENQRFVVPIE